MAVGDIGGIGPAQPPLDVRALAAQIALTNAKALAATLTPGEILTGRVGADMGDGNVALTVRGQTLIANSATTLLPDSLVKLVVQSTGEQPVLRILNATLPELVSTSTPTTRAVALGLPPSTAATTVLQAFEEAGAPLDPTRLKEAVAQVQNLPPAQAPQRAQALAALAQAGLPTTAPLVALAERSVSGTLPNPAAAVQDFQRVVQSAAPPLPAAATTTQPPVAVARAPEPVSRQPTTGGAPAAVPIPQPPISNVPPSVIGIRPPAVGSPPASATPPPASTTPAPLPPAPPPASAPPPPAVSSEPAPARAPVVGPSPTTLPAATLTSTAPQSSPSTVPLPLAPGSPVPASAAPAATLVMSQVPVATTLAGTLVPDLARGGATAVLQALVLAGVRPRDTGEVPLPKPEPTLLHRLDVPIEEPEAIRASIDSTTRHPQQPALDAAVAHVMREQAAETVVKPQALVDYDIVLGLPLQVQGQPMPARLAIAERQTSAGTATFLRVDAELTALGPLSVRISGIENGPMAITVLATGPALGALAEALPDLTASLRELGLTAGVRIADLAEDLDRG